MNLIGLVKIGGLEVERVPFKTNCGACSKRRVLYYTPPWTNGRRKELCRECMSHKTCDTSSYCYVTGMEKRV